MTLQRARARPYVEGGRCAASVWSGLDSAHFNRIIRGFCRVR
jgi:hypothetical protein